MLLQGAGETVTIADIPEDVDLALGAKSMPHVVLLVTVMPVQVMVRWS
jgi:hypothetical protein